MIKVLASIMAQLNQISVRGDDVERMYAVRNMIRQLQQAFAEAKTENEKKTQQPEAKNDGVSN